MANQGTIPKVRAGEPISARDFNALIDVVNTLRMSRGGPQYLDRIAGRVTRIYGNPVEDLIGNVFYDFEAVGIDVKLIRRAPDYGRALDEPDVLIRPARVNARCFFLRFINENGEMDYAVELPFGGKGERLSPSRCGQNAARFPSLRRMMISGGGALGPPAPPGGGGPDVGGGGSPVGTGTTI